MTAARFNTSRQDDQNISRAGELFRYLFIPLAVSVFSLCSVYWLRENLMGSDRTSSGGSIQVHLLPLRDAIPLAMAQEVHSSSASVGRTVDKNKVEPVEQKIVTAALEGPSHSSVVEIPAEAAPAPLPPRQMVSVPPAVAKFQRALLHHIEHFQHYPAAARRDHVEGTVLVVFSVRRDGWIANMQIKTSSGQSSLDKEALETLRRAQPLPAIPAELPSELNILLPIAFDLS
jgi:periplasmic protein TonB